MKYLFKPELLIFSDRSCGSAEKHAKNCNIRSRASASFYLALVNLTKECKISLVKCQMA